MKPLTVACHVIAAVAFVWLAVDEATNAVRAVRDPWDSALKHEAERVKADVGEVKES